MSIPYSSKSAIFIGALSLDVAIIDQITKWVAVTHLQTPLNITSWLSLGYAENTGIAFSLPIPYIILIPFSFVLIGAILAYGFRSLNIDSPLTIAVLGCITGGAVGNVIDRIFRGFVVDFIKVGWWPTFNLSDVFLSIGIFLLIVFYGKIKRV